MKKILMITTILLMGISMVGCTNKINKEEVDNQIDIIKECFDESREIIDNINGYLGNDGSDLIGQTENINKIEEKLKEVSIDNIENLYKNEEDFKKLNLIIYLPKEELLVKKKY